VGYFIIALLEFIAKSVGDRVFKNCAKLEAKVEWRLFSGHGVKSCASISSID